MFGAPMRGEAGSGSTDDRDGERKRDRERDQETNRGSDDQNGGVITDSRELSSAQAAQWTRDAPTRATDRVPGSPTEELQLSIVHTAPVRSTTSAAIPYTVPPMRTRLSRVRYISCSGLIRGCHCVSATKHPRSRPVSSIEQPLKVIAPPPRVSARSRDVKPPRVRCRYVALGAVPRYQHRMQIFQMAKFHAGTIADQLKVVRRS